MGKSHSRKSKGKSWWAAQIAAFERSGLSQRAFCETRGLSKSTFAKWRRRVQADATALAVADERPQFVELELPAVAAPLVRVSIGRLHVDFETLPPPAWVAELAACEASRC